MSSPHAFSKRLRLSGAPAFAAVYQMRLRESRGPLLIYARPDAASPLRPSRIGLSVSRKVGTAPRRNRIKRLLRESFRLLQHDLPTGFDFVVVVKPHAPLALAEYQDLMRLLMPRLHAAWKHLQTRAN